MVLNCVLGSDVTTFVAFDRVQNCVTDCPVQGCSLNLENYCSCPKRPSEIHRLSNNSNFSYFYSVQFSLHPRTLLP